MVFSIVRRMPVKISPNGLQPGVSGDSGGLRTIGKIKYFREKQLKARQIKPLRLTAVNGCAPLKSIKTEIFVF